MLKHLIKSTNIIYTFVNKEWVDTGLTEPLSAQNFIDFGVEDLSILTIEQWSMLIDPEILTWTDNISTPIVEIEIEPITPYDMLRDDEFELLTYTNADNDPIIELAVSEHTPLDLFDNPKLVAYTSASNLEVNYTAKVPSEVTVNIETGEHRIIDLLDDEFEIVTYVDTDVAYENVKLNIDTTAPSEVKKTISFTDLFFDETFNLSSFKFNRDDKIRVTKEYDDGSTEIIEVATPIPNTPTNLNYTLNGYSINYTWDSVPCDGYRLYDEDGTLIADVSYNSYSENGITEQRKNVYVVSYDIFGESIPSNYLLVETTPVEPKDLIIAQLPNGIKLNWTNQSSIQTGFKIYRRISNGSWVLVGDTNQQTYSDIVNVQSNILYEYEVCAYNNKGQSSFITWGFSTVDSVVLTSNLLDSESKINYSWNSLTGVSGYRLSLTDNITMEESVINVASNSYNYTFNGSKNVSAKVVAYLNTEYGEFTSEDSNVTSNISSPREVISDFRCIPTKLEDGKYSLEFVFTDNSNVETGFTIKYKIDNGSEVSLDIPSTTNNTIGTEYKKNIVVDATAKQVKAKVNLYNATGVSLTSEEIIMIVAPDIVQSAYIGIGSQAKFGWIDNTTTETGYRIIYNIDGGQEQFVDINTTSSGVIGKVYTHNIALSESSVMRARLYAVVNGQIGLPSDEIIISKASYQKAIAPTDFSATWVDIGVAEYSWTKNSDEVVGYRYIYKVNDGEEITLDFPVTNIKELGQKFSYRVTLTENLDMVSARVIPYTLVDDGVSSITYELTYIMVDTNPPPNFRKERTENGVTFKWDSLEYVYTYQVHYYLNGELFVYETLANEFYLELPDGINSVYVYAKAIFAGGAESDFTKAIEFYPTIQNFITETILKNTVSTEFTIEQLTRLNNVGIILQLETSSHNQNVETTIKHLEAITLSYNVSTHGDLTTMSVYKIQEVYDISAGFTNYNTSVIYYLNSITATDNIETLHALATISVDKDISSVNYLHSSVKNTNVTTNHVVSALVFNTDVLQKDYYIYSVFYEQAHTDIAPIYYVINNKHSLQVSIETEIHKIRIVTIGDSITAGHPGFWAESGTGVVESQYQYWLQRRLGSDFEVINKGYGSDTTLRCLNRFDKDVIKNYPNYVIIHAGTNDLYWAMAESKDDQEYLNMKMQQAKDNILTMVRMSHENGIIPIIGTLIPRTTAQGIYRKGLWDFNEWIKDYANSEENVYYADFYNGGKENIPPTPLEEVGYSGNLNPLYDGDSVFDTFGNLIRRGYGVHPNIEGYKIMAEAVPLTIFQSLSSEVKMYIDEECTIEEQIRESGTLERTYTINLHNIDRGRNKKTTRYLKNVGNRPIIYSIYKTQQENATLTFSNNANKFTDYVSGKLDPQGVHRIDISLDIPRMGQDPEIDVSLAMRSFANIV